MSIAQMKPGSDVLAEGPQSLIKRTGEAVEAADRILALAKAGVNYTRAYNQNTVCMPARSTMLTGQYVRTHGVFSR